MITAAEIDKTYKAVCAGVGEPAQIVTVEGLFCRTHDGWVVYDYDADGNLYELPAEEQSRRIEQLRKRLAESK